ncbi:MAG: thiamine pyrophosphate-dependent dehydrogenase E1 component subunit alpha [Candidatus Lokiarchaeota archaeon]|nr:thiamine pyrophosphate-dependent dehydrogenase E1 component subunit alpha [Candidatus Lokiarchaeota archaeon]
MSSVELPKDLSSDELINLYKKMLLIREFELRISKDTGKIKSPFVHAYTGEEAIAVGACAAINDNDYITSTHRGHGHFIAKGGDINSLMAEIYGKEEGICKGRGGSMHVADFSKNMLGANGIVGAGPPLALGVALASKMRNEGKVVLTFFGDGAANQGMLHETMNLATIWKLPIIFVLENNMYGWSTPVHYASAIKDLSLRAQGYGMKGITIDGNDVIKVYKTIKEAVKLARKGDGPMLIECKTYRWGGQMTLDADKYRSTEEKEEWKKKCPIEAYKIKLIKSELIDKAIIQKIEDDTLEQIKLSIKLTKKSPKPDTNTVLDDIYKNPMNLGGT